MEILPKVKEILANNPFSLIDTDGYKNAYIFLDNNPRLKKFFEHPTINDWYFIKKYGNNIPKGYYGFSIGYPINPVWMKIIDDILEYCLEIDPEIEIRAIKLKFGGIDFHASSKIITDLHDVFILLTTTLRDKALIY